MSLAGGLVIAAMLCACATQEPSSGQSPTTTPTPTPTAACPVLEGVEPPADCAPYDPDDAMALNDAYRERMDTGDEAMDQAFVPPVVQKLEELREGGLVDSSAVQSALADAGLAGAQVREDYGAILFGAMTPSGGCVFGEVSAESVTVEVGGLIQDGGCLAAQ